MAGPSFVLDEHLSAGTACIEASGDLDLATSQQLVDRFEELLVKSPARILLDLRGVAVADSTGIAALIRCRRRAARFGIELELEVGDGAVAQVLDFTHLRRAFETH